MIRIDLVDFKERIKALELAFLKKPIKHYSPLSRIVGNAKPNRNHSSPPKAQIKIRLDKKNCSIIQDYQGPV